MHVLRGNIAEEDGVDESGDPLVFRHAGNGDEVGEFLVVDRFPFFYRLLCLE